MTAIVDREGPHGLMLQSLRLDADVLREGSGQAGLAAETAKTLGVAIAGTAVFGAAAGTFAGPAQALLSALKAPVLLFGTSALCFPAFYVLQGLQIRTPLSLVRALALQAHTLAAIAVVWAALALPLFFLAGTAQHYHLAQALVVVVGTLGGAVGLSRFVKRYRALCKDAPSERMRGALWLYVAIYGIVGAQLSWLLRPFVGSPDQPLQLVRGLQSNFFAYVLGLM